MTNREMAIRMAAVTLEKILAGEEVNIRQTLEVLKAEIEVFDLLNDVMQQK